MTDLDAARIQMAVTLGFHIVLACFGVAFPTLMLVAEWRGRWRADDDALLLARRWSRVAAVLFAVGAVSGTVLTFEMGLLWPGLMGRFGAAYGIPFAVEGVAFFTEAVFLSIYLYGWARLGRTAHLLTGLPVVAAGLVGTFSVVAANAWMNQPSGYGLGPDGRVASVDPIAVIFNPATGYEVLHMFLAAYVVVGFLVASVYAVGLLRGDRSRRTGLALDLALAVAVIATPFQLAVGDVAARAVLAQQPAKFAAMELLPATGPDQPETIGGVLVDGKVVFGLPVPAVASVLAGFDPGTVITGLDAVPSGDQPPATAVHLAWDLMLFGGGWMAIITLMTAWSWIRRRRRPGGPRFLRLVAASGVVAVMALESGWVVTEVGRQPWIVYQVLRTSDAVTDVRGLPLLTAAVVGLYVALGIGTLAVVRIMASRWRDHADESGTSVREPYGPRSMR